MQITPPGRPGTPRLYFAYGSNLNRAEMRVRCPGSKPIVQAQLTGWQLTFRGVADIEPSLGGRVLGALWLVTADDLRSLDRYEGAPTLYRRHKLEVQTSNGRQTAVTYVMCDSDYRGLPSPWYLERIAEGYRDWALPLRPLTQAVQGTQNELADMGLTRYERDGRKRLRAVFDEDGPDAC